ncbi:MAG: hypothetical protein U0350_19100 [Caldilineaceae bacterium]
MVTKELLKIEIDQVQDKYLEALYKIIEAFLEATRVNNTTTVLDQTIDLPWQDFIEATYGCLADDPLERGDQGVYEIREAFA